MSQKFALTWAKDYEPIFKRQIYYNMDYEFVELLINQYGLSNCRREVIERETKKGFKLNWHRDHYNAIRSKRDGNNYVWSCHLNPVPFVTIMYYENTHNEDFIGGVLEFHDGTKIYPKKGIIVILDSNDVHRVTIQHSGIRRVKVIKLYLE